MDLDCGDFLGKHTEAAVNAGLVNEAAIDKAVTNNLVTLMRLGFFDGNPNKQLYGKLGPKDVCTPEHQELAREAARQGIVLLKNSPKSLPLSSSAIKSLAVIGPNANVTKTMIGNYEGMIFSKISSSNLPKRNTILTWLSPRRHTVQIYNTFTRPISRSVHLISTWLCQCGLQFCPAR